MPRGFFVTGTDTGVGKTVVSALLCAALDAMYWKPIQTGTREGTDRATVMRLAGLAAEHTIAEAYTFSPPVSPHLAAKLAGARIDLRKIKWPRGAATARKMVIVEGAGGVLVPVNERQMMIDVIARLRVPVVLVARTALGTINHTLLSLAALREARLEVRGVVMAGNRNEENRQAIERYGRARVIGWAPPLGKLNRSALLRVYMKYFDREAFRG